MQLKHHSVKFVTDSPLRMISYKIKITTEYSQRIVTAFKRYVYTKILHGPVKDQLRHFCTLIEFKIKVSEEVLFFTKSKKFGTAKCE